MVTSPIDRQSRPASPTPGALLTPDERLKEIADAHNQPRAFGLAARAKADGLSHPLIHHLLAVQLRQEGRSEEAIAELGLGLRLAPNDVRLTSLTGFCLLDLSRRQEAAQVFAAAMELDPSYADAAYGYGWAAERLGALESAASAYKRAVVLDNNHADAHAGLSGLAVRRRDWITARVHAEKAAAVDPKQTDALMNLARVDSGQGKFDDAERRLQQIIALPHLKPLARANARLMLGDAIDGAGRYRKAFAAYVKGKSELRDQHAHIFEAPDINTANDAVKGLLGEFQQTPASSWASSAGRSFSQDEKTHAFLMGFPRSGTTLLEQVLATHPDIVALEEREVLIDAMQEYLTPIGGMIRLADVDGATLEPFRDSYWKKVREFGVEPAGKVFVDKHPLSTIRLPLINKMFPQAKIIFARRDPRDVVLSCFRRSFNMNPSMYEFNTIESAARYYVSVMEAGQVYLESLPLDVHFIRYEDLVADFDATTKSLCGFLGIEWTEKLKGFADTARSRPITTPSSTQVGRGLYSEGAGQWRNYDFALKPVLPVLQPWIERFGYEST